MKKIIFATDLHGNETLYNKLLEFSIKNKIRDIIIGGDICPHAHTELNLVIKYQKDFIEKFLIKFFKKLKKENIKLFIMMGNDDFRINYNILEKAEKDGLIKLLHNRLNRINNRNIIGYSFVPQMPFLLKDWEKLDNKNSRPLTEPENDIRTVPKEKGTIEDDLKKIKKLSNPKKTIYVIHSPPYGTKLDVISNGQHVGSKSIKEFINKEQPPLTLHGHIHESPEITKAWKEKINKTLSINPGSSHLNNVLNTVVIDLDDLNMELIKC